LITVAVAQMSLKYLLNEKALTIVLCVMGVLAVAYGMIRPNHTLFIIGLVFVIGGYLSIRKKMKESIQKKNE
jgi:flagellar biosynthesis component FlhA